MDGFLKADSKESDKRRAMVERRDLALQKPRHTVLSIIAEEPESESTNDGVLPSNLSSPGMEKDSKWTRAQPEFLRRDIPSKQPTTFLKSGYMPNLSANIGDAGENLEITKHSQTKAHGGSLSNVNLFENPARRIVAVRISNGRYQTPRSDPVTNLVYRRSKITTYARHFLIPG